MNKAQHILIEGLDLAGKSTACQSLLKKLNPTTELRRNSLVQNNEIYEYADKLRKSRKFGNDVLGYLYLAALNLDLKQFSKVGGFVIQDSTIALRSYSHYKARENEEMANAFLSCLDGGTHPIFDAAFVLTANLENRSKRLEQRQKEVPEEVADDDLAVIRTPELFLRMEKIMIETAVDHFDAVVIDTSYMSPCDVLNAILRHIT